MVTFAETHSHLMESFRAFLKDLEDPAATVLDVGTGTGRVALLVAPHVARVLAADRDEQALRVAYGAAKSFNVQNVQFFATDLDSEPWSEWAPAAVDAVLTHLSFTDKMASQAYDRLKPGGAFVVACFGPDQWRETGRVSRYVRTPEDVKMRLESAGFEVTEVLVEKLVASFSNFDQVRDSFFGPGHPVAEAWARDGRWTALEEHFRRGGNTFTESRVVARAYKPGGGPRSRVR